MKEEKTEGLTVKNPGKKSGTTNSTGYKTCTERKKREERCFSLHFITIIRHRRKTWRKKMSCVHIWSWVTREELLQSTRRLHKRMNDTDSVVFSSVCLLLVSKWKEWETKSRRFSHPMNLSRRRNYRDIKKRRREFNARSRNRCERGSNRDQKRNVEGEAKGEAKSLTQWRGGGGEYLGKNLSWDEVWTWKSVMEEEGILESVWASTSASSRDRQRMSHPKRIESLHLFFKQNHGLLLHHVFTPLLLCLLWITSSVPESVTLTASKCQGKRDTHAWRVFMHPMQRMTVHVSLAHSCESRRGGGGGDSGGKKKSAHGQATSCLKLKRVSGNQWWIFQCKDFL